MPNNISQTECREDWDLLRQNLEALRVPDVCTRLRAFDYLRMVPQGRLKLGYDLFRRRTPPTGWELDCLERVAVEIPQRPIACERCVCTVVGPGYEQYAEAMMDSLSRFGESPDVHVVVFAVDDAYNAIGSRDGVTVVRCRLLERLSPAVKGAVYSVSRFVQAKQFLALEADMLIVGSLRPLWDLLSTADPDIMFGCRTQHSVNDDYGRLDLLSVLSGQGAPPSDMDFLTGRSDYNNYFWFNGGTLAGGAAAFAALDARMRSLGPNLLLWIDGAFRVDFGDEFAMNLCVGLNGKAAELAPVFNHQFWSGRREDWLETSYEPSGLRLQRRNETCRILHFTSPGRLLLWEVKAEIDQYGVVPT